MSIINTSIKSHENIVEVQKRTLPNETQINIFKKIMQRKNEYLWERIEDHYYADTWEQASQISKEIDKIEAEIKTIENFLKTGERDRSIRKIVHEEVFRRTIPYRQ